VAAWAPKKDSTPHRLTPTYAVLFCAGPPTKEAEVFQDSKKFGSGRMAISYGELNCEGTLVGLTVREVREMLEKQLPPDTTALPADAVITVTTMDDQDEAWKSIASEQQLGLLTMAMDGGLQILQGATKEVTSEYVIRNPDIFLSIKPRTA
jgi:hypothetical protein